LKKQRSSNIEKVLMFSLFYLVQEFLCKWFGE